MGKSSLLVFIMLNLTCASLSRLPDPNRVRDNTKTELTQREIRLTRHACLC